MSDPAAGQPRRTAWRTRAAGLMARLGTGGAASRAVPLGDVMMSFESIGDNCEFGVVQRVAGVEPLGLLRFSSAPIASLIDALDTDFRAYGADGDLEISDDPLGRTYCVSRRYGFAYQVADYPPGTEPARLRAREERKVAYLKARFLEDLAAGEKVLVRKCNAPDSMDDIARLVRAVRRHGRCTLLRVLAAEDGQPVETVTWRRDGVMDGRVRRLAAYETATDVDAGSWFVLCEAAYRLKRGLAAGRPGAGGPNLLAGDVDGPTLHRVGTGRALPGGQPADGELFVRQRSLHDLDVGTVHAFSAWVWVPAGFTGTRVAAVVGHTCIRSREADLAAVEGWQHVWFTSKLPSNLPKVAVGLLVAGAPGAHVWSAGWRLEAWPVPSGIVPPTAVPEA